MNGNVQISTFSRFFLFSDDHGDTVRSILPLSLGVSDSLYVLTTNSFYDMHSLLSYMDHYCSLSVYMFIFLMLELSLFVLFCFPSDLIRTTHRRMNNLLSYIASFFSFLVWWTITITSTKQTFKKKYRFLSLSLSLSTK